MFGFTKNTRRSFLSSHSLFWKVLSCLMVLSVLLTAVSCTSETSSGSESDSSMTDEATSDSSSETLPDEGSLSLSVIEDGQSEFTVIRAEKSSSAIYTSSITLRDRIKEYTGVTVSIATDFYIPSKDEAVFPNPEILVGETNRPESQEVLASLPEHSYTIAVRGNKLVILGTNDTLTALALYEFEDKVLKNPDCCKENSLVIPPELCQTVSFENDPSFADFIKGGYPIVASTKFVLRCTPYSSSIRVAQGAASDGTYAYFVIRHTSDEGAVVYKYDLTTKEKVAQTAVLDLGHGNDMTYDPVNNRLVVAHGQSEGKILTLINAETMELIGDITIPAGSGAIAYDVENNRYAISQGGSTIHILDADFRLQRSYTRAKIPNYTAQGMGCDSQYLYFPMSGSKDNIIAVYDWSGNYVTTIKIADSWESESMFYVNGTYYISYYKGPSDSGAYLYRLEFQISYQ